jgi:citrate lyase subunit beta/citryl-CoA lyase
VILRSLLYAPANHERHATKALRGAADGVILDLEDAVAIDQKANARHAVVELLRSRPAEGPQAYVRVNGLSTPFGYDDLLAVAPISPDGIVLPKCESERDVMVVDWFLAQLERQAGLESGGIHLIPIIETAAGLANVDQIASASRRVSRINFGAGDFTLDTGMTWEPENEGVLWAKIRVVLASRTAGLDAPLDTVFRNLDDPDGLLQEARKAKRLGFQGKNCIHPAQVEIVNSVFTPTAVEVARARRLVDAFESAARAGTASIVVDGEFVDYPIAERARRTVALADRLEAKHSQRN